MATPRPPSTLGRSSLPRKMRSDALLARAILTHHKVLDPALDESLTIDALDRVLSG